MGLDQMILENFKSYDNFLATLKAPERERLTSLKMMYSVHMAHNDNVKMHEYIKQMLRFLLKLASIAFTKRYLSGMRAGPNCAVFENSNIEEYISHQLDIPIVKIEKAVSFNVKMIDVYRDLFNDLYLLFKSRELKKRYIFVLMHRFVDYLMVYHTMEDIRFNTLFIENDRSPEHLGLIHFLREKNIQTVKYDNWLIDPIHHNDVYCDYYFYPSVYHKKIIQSFTSNDDLKLVEGGFLSWDALAKYKSLDSEKEKKIIYFTQFGVPLSEHRQYISDILNTLDELEISYVIRVKIHPKESKEVYKELLNEFNKIVIIDACDDIFSLIAESDYCFSIFSTISLEAKHIINNSFFINYNAGEFRIVNYEELHIDLIESKEKLLDLFKGPFLPSSQEKFIKNMNCKYPNSMETLKESFCND